MIYTNCIRCGKNVLPWTDSMIENTDVLNSPAVCTSCKDREASAVDPWSDIPPGTVSGIASSTPAPSTWAGGASITDVSHGEIRLRVVPVLRRESEDRARRGAGSVAAGAESSARRVVWGLTGYAGKITAGQKQVFTSGQRHGKVAHVGRERKIRLGRTEKHMPSSVRSQITEFESKVASLLAGFATEESVSKAGLEENLRTVGVTAKVTATGSAVKVEVEVPEHPGFRASENPEDFTEAARNRRAEEYLARRKARVWESVRSMSSITSEQKVSVLRGLGYSDANLPSQKTSVTAEIADPAGRGYSSGEGYRNVSFTLDGEHTKDEVRERLESVVPDIPATAAVLSAFPDADVPSDFGKVRYLSVHAELTWPREYTA